MRKISILLMIVLSWIGLGTHILLANSYAYVANCGSNFVSVLDTTSNTLQTTIGMGGSCPNGVAITPDRSYAYTVVSGINSVKVIDTATNTVAATISVGSFPRRIAVTPDGTRMYVTNSSSNNVSVIDTTSNTVIATVGVGASPAGIAVTPDGTRAYVANMNSAYISVIDTTSNTVIANVGVGTTGNFGVAVSPDGTSVYAGQSNRVSVIDTVSNTVVTTVTVGGGTIGESAITPDGTRVYVPNANSSQVNVIDTASNTVITNIGVGATPRGIAITPDGTRAYVTHYTTSYTYVSVIDTVSNTVITTVNVLAASSGIAIMPVANSCGNTITELTEYKWWSVSRPCGITTNPTIKELFANSPVGAGLGVYGDENDWVMWKLNGTNPDGSENYTMIEDPNEVMKSGVGYWIITSTTGVMWDPGSIAKAVDPTGLSWNVPTIGTVTPASLSITDADVKEFLVVAPTADLNTTLVQENQLALLGNPFTKTITWSNVYFSNDNGSTYEAIDGIALGVREIAYVSDPNVASGQPYEAVSSVAGFKHTIDPNQAFWIKMIDGSTTPHASKRIALPLEY